MATVDNFAIFVSMSRKDYYNLTQLKERGWTPSMVKKIVDIPPTEFKGMYARQPQKCYPKDYIETLEQSELFAELKLKAAGRQAAMKAVADAKCADNIAKFSARVGSVKIPALTEDELKMRRAILLAPVNRMVFIASHGNRTARSSLSLNRFLLMP